MHHRVITHPGYLVQQSNAPSHTYLPRLSPESYRPESPSLKPLGKKSPWNFVHDLQPSWKPSKLPIDPRISSSLSRNCRPKPAAMWNGMWQCINQAPGLSDSKASTRYPKAGRVAVSRRVGLSVLRRDMSPVHWAFAWESRT